MTVDEVSYYFKSSYRFHKITGMSARSLRNWINWGYIPEGSQYKLEKLTEGKLKAEWPPKKDKNEKR